MLCLHQSVLDVIFNYLTVQDLVNTSLTCSALNYCVTNFLCAVGRSRDLQDILPRDHDIIDILEENIHHLNESEKSQLYRLRRCKDLYRTLKTEQTCLSKMDLYIILHRKRQLMQDIDNDLSGTWILTFEESGELYAYSIPIPFKMVLNFYSESHTFTGFSDDFLGDAGDMTGTLSKFAVITGMYNEASISFVKFYKGNPHQYTSFEGTLRRTNRTLIVTGVWQGIFFYMYKCK